MKNRDSGSWSIYVVAVLACAVSLACAVDEPDVNIRVVDNQLQLGTAVARPYYVQWRTPKGDWLNWTETSLPGRFDSCVWLRAIFEPEDPFQWEIPEDVTSVYTVPSALPPEGSFIPTVIGEVSPTGPLCFVQPVDWFSAEMEGSGSDAPASTPRNNQAMATPDPGRVKMYWHNSNTRYVAAWMMSDDGTLKSFGLSNEGGMAAGWDLVGIGDINKDGIDDLFWHNSSTRKVAFWIMEPDGYIGSSGFVSENPMAAGWSVRAVGDLNRDGTADIIWHNSLTRTVAYWMINDDGSLDSYGFSNDGGMAAGWELVGSGDIDGDGTMDLLWHNSSNRRVAFWIMNSDGTLDTAGYCNDGGMAAGWVFRGTGDILGDGTVGIFWHNSASTRVAYWILGSDGVLDDYGFCNDGGMAAGWVLSAVGDMNNDGKADLIWHNSSTRKVAYWLLNDGVLDDSGFSTDLTMSAGWTVKGAGL